MGLQGPAEISLLKSDDGLSPDTLAQVLYPAETLRIYNDWPACETDLKSVKRGYLLTGTRILDELPLTTEDEKSIYRNFAPILLYSSNVSVAQATHAIRLGVWAVAQIPIEPTELRERFDEAIDVSINRYKSRQEYERMQQQFSSLTPEEFEVLESFVLGKSSKQIALQLDISARTVDRRKQSLSEKLEAESLADLMLTYLRWSNHPMQIGQPTG